MQTLCAVKWQVLALKITKALKLHKQFGHPSAEKLVKLIRVAGWENSDLEKCITAVVNTCEICCRYKKARPSPVVSMPFASSFNELVAVDLKAYGKVHFLVMVDHATRFCAAIVISNKKAETVIRGLFLAWITIFGAPKKLLSDNGGEFNNADMRELGEQFNLKIMTTAAESPWSNGVCERLNAVLGNSVHKIQEDTGCCTEVALAWAVSSRNALSNFSGYSPNQLVFGRNPVYPSISENDPPALDLPEVSEIVRENLNAMHSAREDFVRKESDERVKRALRHNIRESFIEDIDTGSEVFYKRADSNKWHGPGVVIGRDGKQVLVKHGGVYVRVHSCRLSKAPETSVRNAGPSAVPRGENQTGPESVPNSAPVNRPPVRRRDSEDTTFAANEAVSDGTEPSEDAEPSPSDEEPSPSNEEPSSSEEEPSPSNEEPSSSEEEPTALAEAEGSTVEERSREQPAPMQLQSAVIKPKVGLRIQGICATTGEYFSGTIVSRAGKSTGKNKSCFNVKNDNDGNVNWVNFDEDFETWKVTSDEEEMLILLNSDAITEAKGKEIANWVQNDVYEEVEFNQQPLLSVRWVVTEKVKNGENVLKARLVARGFEEYTNELRKDSPTCAKESVRVTLAIAMAQNWECHSIDVKAAYLQGYQIDRDVYLNPPPEYRNGKVWKLKKTVYGLCDAARAWYLRVKCELQALNVEVSTVDPALFYWKNAGKCEGVICVYVDDFLWAGTKMFEESVINKIRDMFLIGGAECKSFKYIGLNIETFDEGVYVDQCQYASSLKPMCLSRKRSMEKGSDLVEAEKSEYRALIGQLNWIATHSRPDVSFDVCELSTKIKNAKVEDVLRLNKVIERVTHDHMKVFFPRLQSLDACHLECFSDASFGNLSDCGSQGGFIVFLKDRSGKRCPLLWQSKKIRRVVKSTLSAETMALLDCAEAAVYINFILCEVSGCQPLEVSCFVDNKSLVDSLQSTNAIEDRRLRIDMAVLRGMLDAKEVKSIAWIASAQQLANCLTKRGASTVQLRAAVSV